MWAVAFCASLSSQVPPLIILVCVGKPWKLKEGPLKQGSRSTLLPQSHGPLGTDWTDYRDYNPALSQPAPSLPSQNAHAMIHYLVVESCDQPELCLQVCPPFLCCDKLQKVFMLHARSVENLPLTLPRLLILKQGEMHHQRSRFPLKQTAPSVQSELLTLLLKSCSSAKMWCILSKWVCFS